MIWLWILWALVLTFGIIAFRGAPYVPSRRQDIENAFTKLYALDKADFLVDMGSGDGTVLRLASRCGAKAVGFELNPILVILSRFFSRRDPNVRVRLADFWVTPLPDDTTVVYGFLVTRDVKKMIRRMNKEVIRLNRPIHYISYGSKLTGLTPDKTLGANNLYTFSPLQIREA